VGGEGSHRAAKPDGVVHRNAVNQKLDYKEDYEVFWILLLEGISNVVIQALSPSTIWPILRSLCTSDFKIHAVLALPALTYVSHQFAPYVCQLNVHSNRSSVYCLNKHLEMPKRSRRVTVSPVHIVLRGVGKLQIESAEDIGESCEKLRVRETIKEIVVSVRILQKMVSKCGLCCLDLRDFHAGSSCEFLTIDRDTRWKKSLLDA
jgi:hypothetical protein